MTTAQITYSSTALFTTLWSNFTAGLSAMVTKMQIGQMERALHMLPDSALAQHGITRSEIADYAPTLVR